jgi:pimeloyl-ACP methyl ester carboxylesterase
LPSLHYEAAGDGIPIVLLHGIGSNAKSWRRQLNAFSRRFKVIAWDAPGYGQSADPDWQTPAIHNYSESLRELLDTLGIPSAVIFGHSLGGTIAQDFYGTYPERVKGLILADTTQGDGALPVTVRQDKLAERMKMIRTMTPVELARARAPKLFSKRAPQDLIAEAVTIMSEVRESGYAPAAIALSTADVRHVLNKINVPLLLIWGSEDEITPPWKQFPKSAEIEMIPNAGHLCYMEQPDVFNRIVLEFLQKFFGQGSAKT